MMLALLSCLLPRAWSPSPIVEAPQGRPPRYPPALVLWRLKRAVESIAGHPIEHGVLALRRLDEPLRSSVLNAVRVLESLIQAAERRHAGQSGRGAAKKREVVAAATTLIGQRLPDLIRGPDSGPRRVIEACCGILVDLIVGLLNANGLWAPPAAVTRGPSAFTRFLRTVLGWVIRVLLFLLSRAVRVRVRLAGFDDDLLGDIPEELARALATSLAALRAASAELALHQRELAGCIQAVASAVQEAETWLGTPGPEKQAHARRLIMLFLRDLQLPAPVPVIEVAIDAVVDIFNRRCFFVHRRSAA